MVEDRRPVPAPHGGHLAEVAGADHARHDLPEVAAVEVEGVHRELVPGVQHLRVGGDRPARHDADAHGVAQCAHARRQAHAPDRGRGQRRARERGPVAGELVGDHVAARVARAVPHRGLERDTRADVDRRVLRAHRERVGCTGRDGVRRRADESELGDRDDDRRGTRHRAHPDERPHATLAVGDAAAEWSPPVDSRDRHRRRRDPGGQRRTRRHRDRRRREVDDAAGERLPVRPDDAHDERLPSRRLDRVGGAGPAHDLECRLAGAVGRRGGSVSAASATEKGGQGEQGRETQGVARRDGRMRRHAAEGWGGGEGRSGGPSPRCRSGSSDDLGGDVAGYGRFRIRFDCQRMIHWATETLSAAIA